MFENLFIKLHVMLLSLRAVLIPRRVATARRGAELMEVAVYAGIILTIALIIRAILPGTFSDLMNDIRRELLDRG